MCFSSFCHIRFEKCTAVNVLLRGNHMLEIIISKFKLECQSCITCHDTYLNRLGLIENENIAYTTHKRSPVSLTSKNSS